VPLLGVVSRLVRQKGIDLLAEAIRRILGMDVQVALLGAGEPGLQGYFESLSRDCPDRFACRIGYNEELAHKIIAGSDFFLMPSRSEPCGLTQMYCMRYGTLPVVHATGGLNDTVADIDESESRGTGFKFYDLTADALFNTLARALRMYREKPETMNVLVAGIMRQRFTWEAASKKYEELYAKALEIRTRKKKRSAERSS
jgi:starch synthase